MGAVVNMRPDLWCAVVMGVPFVDVVTTMLDPTIPLTVIEARPLQARTHLFAEACISSCTGAGSAEYQAHWRAGARKLALQRSDSFCKHRAVLKAVHGAQCCTQT